MTKRVEQVASTLHRTVAEVVRRGLNDPRTEGSLISVTRVDVSPDLHHASVYVTVFPAEAHRKVLAGLKHAQPHIQREVRKGTALRIVPRIEFRYDEQYQKQREVLGAIHDAMKRSGETPAADEPDNDKA